MGPLETPLSGEPEVAKGRQVARAQKRQSRRREEASRSTGTAGQVGKKCPGPSLISPADLLLVLWLGRFSLESREQWIGVRPTQGWVSSLGAQSMERGAKNRFLEADGKESNQPGFI